MKKALLFIFLFVGTFVQAQNFWTKRATGETGSRSHVLSISIVDENTTWLNMTCTPIGCINITKVYSKTTDGGNTWNTANINLGTADDSKYNISNIVGISPSVAYAGVYPRAAGYTGGIWKTVDGGVSWVSVGGSAFSHVHSYLAFVHFWNENEGIVAGDPVNGYFEFYTTSDAGANWTRVPSSNTLIPVDQDEYLLCNNFTVKDNTIWFGTSFGRMFKSSDKGSTWTVNQTPIADFGAGVNGDTTGRLAFTDVNNGLLQSYTTVPTWEGKLFKTTNGGANWTEISYTGQYRNFNICAVPGMNNAYIMTGEDMTDNSQRGFIL